MYRMSCYKLKSSSPLGGARCMIRGAASKRDDRQSLTTGSRCSRIADVVCPGANTHARYSSHCAIASPHKPHCCTLIYPLVEGRKTPNSSQGGSTINELLERFLPSGGLLPRRERSSARPLLCRIGGRSPPEAVPTQ